MATREPNKKDKPKPAPELAQSEPDLIAVLLAKAAEQRGGPALEALERAADLLVVAGNPEDALFRLEEALRRAHESAVDPRVVARIAVSAASLHESVLGRLDRAVELLELSHKLDPDQPTAIEAGRRIYAAIGDLPQVARLYEVELETLASTHVDSIAGSEATVSADAALPRRNGSTQREVDKNDNPARRIELLVALADVREKLDDAVAAAERIEQAVELDPQLALRERLANLYAGGTYAEQAGDDHPLALRRAAELFRALAVDHGAAGRRDDEIGAYRRALGAAPDDVEAARGLEAAYRKTSRIAELQRLYQQAPWLPGAARHVAELAMNALIAPGAANTHAPRIAAAVDALTTAALGNEEIADLLTQLEGQLQTADDHRRVAQLYEQILPMGDDRDPLDRADRLVVIAKHHRAAGELLRFETALLDALEAYPGHDEAFSLATEHLTARRDYATLVALAEAALAAAPPDEHPRRLEELAELYDKRLGDVAGAIETWTRRQAFGHFEKAETELRRLKVKQDRWAGLVANLDKELDLATSPDLRAEVLRRLGQIHRERHDLPKARELFGAALELRPQDPSLYRTLGEMAELEGRYDELAQLLRRQYKAAKERVEKLNLLRRLSALYEERLGDWEGTRWACEEILTHLPSDRDALVRLALGHEAEGAEGLDSLLRVLEAHAQAAATPGEKIELYRRLARLYDDAGKHDLAAERWERIVRLDKSDAHATRMLAADYDKLARHADAALAYGRLLDTPRGGGQAPAMQLDENTRADAWRAYARLVDHKLADPTRARTAWEALVTLRPADREALLALTALHRTRNDARALEALLERRLTLATSDERNDLALEIARLMLARKALPEARVRVEALLVQLGRAGLATPMGEEALTLASELARAARDPRAEIFSLERRYFATDPPQRPPLARKIADQWRSLSPQSAATLLAWERVQKLTPDDPGALAELSERYAEAGRFDAQRVIDLHRLDLAEQASDRKAAVALGQSLARLIEDKLGDVRAAFAQLERALGPVQAPLHDRVLDDMRALAERGSLFDELQRVLGDEPGLTLRLERAQILEVQLNDPRRAFDVVREATRPEIFSTLGPPTQTVAHLLPHLLHLGELVDDTPAVLYALREVLPALPTNEQMRLLFVRAEVREMRGRDTSGALDELLRAVPLVDGTAERDTLDSEIRRLAAMAERADDLLAFVSLRAAQAPRGTKQRLALLEEAAVLAEKQLEAPLRAFRVRLTMLAQLDDPLAPTPELERELWRLAAAVTRDQPTLPEEEIDFTVLRTRLDPLFDNGPLEMPGAPRTIVQSSKPARDNTLEVDVGDMIVEPTKPRRADPTAELSISDLAVATRGAPPPPPARVPGPPPLPGVRGGRPPPPLPNVPPKPNVQLLDGAWLLTAPSLDQPLLSIEGPHGAWDELAEVLRRAERDGDNPSTRARLVVARTFEDGALDIERAFGELLQAFLESVRTQSPTTAVRGALDAVAQRHKAEDRVVDILDEAIAGTASSERAVALYLDSAGVRVRQGKLDDAEARYHRALGIRPGIKEATDWLEAYYRKSNRLDLLAGLLEQRLDAVFEPPSAERRAQAFELAEIYERNGQKYEAIATIEGMLSREPENAGALVRLEQLYEAVGQWGKVVDAIGRRIDLLEAGDGSAQQPEARRLRLRIAQLYENELERPERALETYRSLDRGIPDPAAQEGLERLLVQMGRFAELDTHWAKRADAATGDEAAKLLRRRVELLREHPRADVQLVDVLRLLIARAPEDDAAFGQLDDALAALTPNSKIVAERIDVVARRLQLAEANKASPDECARLLQKLGTLEAAAGRTQEAIHTLEQAVALSPEAHDIASTLSELRERSEDQRGLAEAREREASLAVDDRDATQALIGAARAEVESDRVRAANNAEQAFARCPQDMALLGDIRVLFEALGNGERVVTVLRRQLDLLPGRGLERAKILVELGTALRKNGELDAAMAALHHAHDAEPGYVPAVHVLADLAAETNTWEDVESVLRYAVTAPGVKPLDIAALQRRIAEAATARGNYDEAYAALIEADRRRPGDVRTRMQLGRNRFAQGRFREAAQHLGAVAEHADLKRLGPSAAQALYEGAQAELKIRRPERANALLQAALELDPAHEPTLGMLASHALERGDRTLASQLLERQAAATDDAQTRAQRWERVATIVRDEIGDAPRARSAFAASIAAWDAGSGESRPPVATLDALLDLERRLGDLHAAAATAGRLLQYSATPSERARRLRESAALEAAIGTDGTARERLAAAHELDPNDAETVAGFSALLVRDGDDEGAATLLTRALSVLPPPTDDDRLARAALWQRLGEARDRLRDATGAAVAFERVLELAPDRRPLRQMLLERYGEDPAYEAEVVAHRRYMLDLEPLDVQSLRSREAIERRAGRTAAADVVSTLQAVAGALALGRPVPNARPNEPLHVPSSLTETELRLLEHPEATALSEVFAALYEGLPQDQLGDLASFGVDQRMRVSPVSDSPAAPIFADCARLLGNRRTTLYVKDDIALTGPQVVVRAPTAIVLSETLAALPASELRFLIGRALWLVRPEHALVVGLSKSRLNTMLMSIVHAFHPRHASARAASDAEIAQLRKLLPYKALKRLTDLFQREADTHFSSARWRRGVEHSANRAGLVVSGDFRAAARVLMPQNEGGDRAALDELARFALTDTYLSLRTRGR